MKDRVIALIDGNNFFAGCEILMNPDLRGKAVCVLSNNDGCVIARSNEAKKLGIKMGMPHFMAKKEFPQAVYLSADFTLYQDLSQRMMRYLSNYSDKIDVYSIDEAFIDITGLDKTYEMSFQQMALKIKSDIEKDIGVSVSVGVANSKVLAKIASHKAKQRNGFYYIEKKIIPYELQNIPIEEIWGVGRNIARSLRSFGIFYADEILLKEDAFYKSKYGKKGLELKYELSGISVLPVTGIVEKPKSIQRTRAFPEFSKDKKYILTELEIHLHSVCKKLRENNLKTDLISVMLRTKDFRVFYREEKLDFLTNSEISLTKIVHNLFEKIYKEGIIYRSSGVWASDLSDNEKNQLSLFTSYNHKKSENITSILDKIEEKYGNGIINVGQNGIKEIREKHKRQMRYRSF